MMKCAEVHPNLGAFVLGGLESEEETEVRRHLAFCPSCQGELEEFEEVSQALKAAPPLADVPPYLKDEILSYVRAEELLLPSSSREELPSSRDTRFRNLRFLFLPSVAAAALVAIVALGTLFSLHTESPVATIQLTPIENEDYWGVAEVHLQPSGNQQVELKLNNLDEPGPHSFYEAWYSSGEEYIGVGAFTTTGSGQTDVVLTAPPQVRNYPTFLITEQSATGDTAPSKNVVLRGEAQ
jgi:putative zinc finger protein/anti-sigma-K factor RskA